MMKFLKSTLFVLLAVLVSLPLAAQSKDEVIKLYNDALELAKENKAEQAIQKLELAITTAQKLGPEGTEIKDLSEKQLPTLYFNKAVAKLTQFQKEKSLSSLNDTIHEFDEAITVATEYKDNNTVAKSRNVLPQLHYQKSVILYRQEDYAGSEASANKAIEMKSDYEKAYYQIGLAYKKLKPDDLDGMLQRFDKAIEVATQTKDARTLRSAKESAHDEIVFRGVKMMENNRLSQALELLQKAVGYNDSADANYRLAEAYNKQGKFDSALSHATKSLASEQGGRTEKAKIYFEIGLAHQGKGNVAEACKALANALYGSFKSPSEHKMEHELKCKSS